MLMFLIGFAESVCQDTCTPSKLLSASCEVDCMSESCNFQNLNPSCLSSCVSSGCPVDLLLNSICDPACNTAICGWDFGSCGFCASNCFVSDLPSCPPQCNLAQCSNALYCTSHQFCAPGCLLSMLGDGNCDSSCLTRSCNFDNGDCSSLQIALDCYQVQIADGICDESCNTITTYWDGWDCACSPGCSPLLLTNSVCDPECNTEDCNFDSQKCSSCSSGCKIEMLGNGVADNECNNPECLFDLGDFSCSPMCLVIMLGNGVCDSACNVIECGYDNGKCQGCAPDCLPSMRNNGICNAECNNAQCNYDDFDCLCASKCLPNMLGNGICNVECFSEVCNLDNNDCSLCDPGCEMHMLGNGHCDSACNTQSCANDRNDCLCSIGCTSTLLSNAVCDQPCNTLACNFDNGNCVPCTCSPSLIGNGVCDAECNSVQCFYDGSDCSCPSNCTPALLSNNICDPECNSIFCAFDNGKCLECARGCKWTQVQDGICQPECNVPECGFDSNDCSCSSSCALTDLFNTKCDTGCNKLECGFDNMLCTSCASNCQISMINNGVCDPECYNIDCMWDGFDCLCSPHCASSNVCDLSCITPACEYSRDICEDGKVIVSIVNSLVQNDVGAVWQGDACLAVSSTCLQRMLNSVCDNDCNVKECLFDMGSCGICGISLCERCVNMVCVQCVVGYWAYMGKCVSYIPESATLFSGYSYFLVPKADVSTYENPQIIYVASGKSAHTETGSLLNPFSSLSTALSSIRSKFTQIYLLQGIHSLIPADLNNPEVIFTNSAYVLLKILKEYKYIKLSTLLCSEFAVSGCSDSPAIILISTSGITFLIKYSAVFEINNIIFDGSGSLNPICFIGSCSYCPYTYTYNLATYNDKAQPIDPRLISTNCAQNHAATFISFERGGELIMKNVTFNKFQQQFFAVLDLSSVNALFVNVSFRYVQSSNLEGSAVIVQNQGSLVWVLGSIAFVNYGYEYVEGIELNAFMSVSGSEFLQLKYLMVDWNTVFGEDSYLFRFTNVAMTVIDYCLFSFNWADGIFNIQYTENVDNKHLVMRNSSLANNVANAGSIINVNQASDIKSLYIDSCEFTNNTLATGLGIISIVSTGSFLTEKAYSLLNNLAFSGNQGGEITCINIDGLRKVNLTNIIVNPYQTPMRYPSENWLYTSIKLEYYSKANKGPGFSKCQSVINIQNTRKSMNLMNIQIKGQLCADVLTLVNNNMIAISYLQFLKNAPVNHLATFRNNSDTIIWNMQVLDNLSNYTGLYVLQNETHIRNSQFSNNLIPTGAISAESSNLHLSNCQFSNNTGEFGSAIYYSASHPSNFSIFSSIFSLNSAKEGIIYISNSLSSPFGLNLYLKLCKFLSNSAFSGSAIFIESRTLASLSTISNSEFESNLGLNLGALILNENPILLSSTQFKYNNATQAAAIYIEKSSNLNSTVQISSSLFSNNTGISIILSTSTVNKPLIHINNTALINNTGHPLSIQNTLLYMDGSYCIANSYSDASCMLALGSLIYLSNSLIQYNMGKIVGAIKVSENSFINCNNCTFDTNMAQYGGAVYISNGGFGNFTNSKFHRNISPYYGPALFIVGSSEPIIISKCQFLDNIVGISGVISLVQSVVSVLYSNFMGNIAIQYSPGVSVSMANLTIISSKFFNQTGYYGSFLSLATLSFSEIYNSTFELASSFQGGAIVLATSMAIIAGCSFKHISSSMGGTISVNTMAYLIMTDILIYNSTSSKGGVIYDTESTLIMTNCTFNMFNDSAIYADKSPLIQISNSKFSNGSTIEDGGGLMCVSCYNITIVGSDFRGMSAVAGAVVSMYYQQNQPKPTCFIQGSGFYDLHAVQGGAISSNDYALTVISSTFNNNSALGDKESWGIAGSIYSACSINNQCGLTLTNNVFENNYAKELGGSVAWTGTTQPVLENNMFSNNAAVYGADIASYAVSMKLVSMNQSENFQLAEVAPGQHVNTSLIVQLLDHYGQIVKTDNLTTIALSTNDTAFIVSGSVVVSAIEGVVTFDNFYIYGQPGENFTLCIKSSFNNSDVIPIAVSLRNCTIGEALSNKACVTCTKGQYSLDPSGPCLECLPEAVCYGNYSIVPKEGYWRPDMYTINFYKCPIRNACLGGGNLNESSADFSLTGVCNTGYTSNLCQSCDQGYSHSTGNICQKCPDMDKNVAYLTVIILLIVLFACGLVYINISMADKPASNYTILIKILLNYIQIIGIVSSLNLAWPDFALEYLKVQETAGSLSQQSFSFDCFLAQKYNRTNSEVYFDKILLYLLLPVLLIIFCLFCWAIVSLIKLDTKYIKNHFVGSIVIIIFMLHTIIVNITLAPFSCQLIDGEYWLSGDLSIKCWEGTHQLYTLSVALPGLVLWALLIPMAGIFFTRRNKHNFDRLEIKQRYGFIIAGYTYDHYYWEFIIIYRKALVISGSIFFGSLSVELQTLSILIILLLASYIQADLKPFADPALNRMEFRSILVSVVTIYCGLYYLAPDINFTGQVLLFIILVVVNLVFFGYWLYYFVRDFVRATVDVLRKLWRKRFEVKPDDGIEKEGVPIVNIHTSEDNAMFDGKRCKELIEEEEEEEKGGEEEDVQVLRPLKQSRESALTFINRSRNNSSNVVTQRDMRNTVKYNAFDNSFNE